MYNAIVTNRKELTYDNIWNIQKQLIETFVYKISWLFNISYFYDNLISSFDAIHVGNGMNVVTVQLRQIQKFCIFMHFLQHVPLITKKIFRVLHHCILLYIYIINKKNIMPVFKHKYYIYIYKEDIKYFRLS